APPAPRPAASPGSRLSSAPCSGPTRRSRGSARPGLPRSRADVSTSGFLSGLNGTRAGPHENMEPRIGAAVSLSSLRMSSARGRSTRLPSAAWSAPAPFPGAGHEFPRPAPRALSQEVPMRPSLLLLSVATLVLVLLAAPVLASIPYAGNSTLPSCLLTTPGGNIASLIIVRDLNNNPVSNSFVTIDYTNCAGFVPCTQGGPDAYTLDLVNHRLTAVTGRSGQVAFYVRAGGGCSNSGIAITADGVPMTQIPAASADQNGDLAVDGADVALVHAKIGGSDRSGDMNCDGVVNAADESIVAGYVGVNCLHPTGDRPSTWGRVKVIYR